MKITICIASDHAGFNLKEELIVFLKDQGYEITDLGPFDDQSVDYPVYAKKLTAELIAHPEQKGILICGTGIGMNIAANRTKGIRAALCYSEETAKLSREHNNANVLCLGARTIDTELAKKITSIWLSTEFSGGRHETRLKMIDD